MRDLGPPLATAAWLRRCDAAAIEAGTDGFVLMARAASAVADAVLASYPRAIRVVCVCGPGNNGGDGLLVAMYLRAHGLDAACWSVSGRERRGAAERARLEALRQGVPIIAGAPDDEAIAGADLVIDALLGTGSVGAPRGDVESAIDVVNRSAAPIVAVDLPSGVDPDTGEIAGSAIRASMTVTFHAPVIGLVVQPGRGMSGDIRVADIGLAPHEPAEAPATLAAFSARDAVPSRPRAGSKYESGSVAVVGGSSGMLGAIVLATRAAFRAGAGHVTALVPWPLADRVDALVLEAVTRACRADEGEFEEAGAGEIVEWAARASALVVGPGIGRGPGAAAVVAALWLSDRPATFDADALFAIATGSYPRRAAPTVVTPHGAEAARLLGWSVERVQTHRLDAARTIAERFGVTCLLKGSDTLIVTGADLVVRDGDEPALATAGSGDVLAGVCGGFLARGADPRTAAAAAAAVHLHAARKALAQAPGRSIVASDLVDHLVVA